MEEIKIIKQVFHNPQVYPPPISYKIADVDTAGGKDYTSKYIDVKDFEKYLKRLEKQLIFRLKELTQLSNK